MTIEQVLEMAQSALSQLVNSSYLDASVLANDCLEDFDNFDWEPMANIDDEKLARWEKLKEKGDDGVMTHTELSEFFDLTDPSCQCHAYFDRIQARKAIDAIALYHSDKKPTATQSHDFVIKEPGEDVGVAGSVDCCEKTTGIALHFDGYSDFYSNDDNGAPVCIEQCDGDVRVVVYADINKEEPTHVISLDGARINKRIPE